MAIIDRITNLVTAGDPAALTATVAKLVGSATDLNIPSIYSRFPSTSQGYILGGGRPVYVNFAVTATFSDQTANWYEFGVYTDGTVSSGSLAAITNPIVLARFNGAVLDKGFRTSLILPAGAYYERYLQIGVTSVTAVSDEAGRLDAWISIDPLSWRTFDEGSN